MRKPRKRSKEELEKKNAQVKLKRYNVPLSDADAAVLRILPKVGEGISPFQPTAWPVKLIVAKLQDQGATHSKVTASVRSMIHRELVKPVELSPRSAGPGYQRTKRGEGFLREYDKERQA